MKHVVNSKIVTGILIPMILISIASYGYAHWTDSVTKKYKLHVQCTQTKIKTNKVLTDWVDDEYIIKVPSDEELSEMDGSYSLSISTDRACPGFDVWIGLMLHNQNPVLSERVYAPTFTVSQDPPDSVSYEFSSFTYGIFSNGDFTDYYAASAGFNRKNFRSVLDPSEGIIGKTPIDLPVVIEPCHKLVIWTYLKLIDGPTQFTVQIEIAVNTELA